LSLGAGSKSIQTAAFHPSAFIASRPYQMKPAISRVRAASPHRFAPLTLPAPSGANMMAMNSFGRLKYLPSLYYPIDTVMHSGKNGYASWKERRLAYPP
jgi:hypothetical protein